MRLSLLLSVLSEILERDLSFEKKKFQSGFPFSEITTNLDNETERQVIDVIESLRGKKTLIVIAHRLSTVKGCDLICRIKDGRIVKAGRFKNIINIT